MKYLYVVALAAQIFIAFPAGATERSTVLDVENMTCALCPITVSTAIEAVPGVTSVKVSMAEKTATVVYDDAVVGLPAIAQASTFAGYPARPQTTP